MIGVLFCCAAISVSAFEYSGSAGAIPAERSVSLSSPLSYLYDFSSFPGQKTDVLTGYFCNPYGIKGLYSSGTCAGAVFKSVYFSGGIDSFGTDYYREIKPSFSATLYSDFFSAGFRGKLYRIKYSGYSSDHMITTAGVDASVSLRLFKKIRLSYFQTDLSSSLCKGQEEIISPVRSLGVSFIPSGGMELCGSISVRNRKKYQIYEAKVNLASNASVALSYSPELSTSAVKTSLYWKKICVEYSFRHHTVLGNSHYVSVSLLSDEISLDVPLYAKSSPSYVPPVRLVDIQTCSADDLLFIEGMTEELAARVINYREIFGNISKRALRNIGIEGDLLNRVLSSVKNIASPEKKTVKKKSKDRKKRTGREDVREKIFADLVRAGVRTSVSMSISRDVRKIGLDKVLKALSSYSMSQEEYQKAAKVCLKYMR